MTEVDTGHWLNEPIRNIFSIYDNKRGDKTKRYTSLEVSVFIFHKGKLLFLQPTGASGWTVPSRTIGVLNNERRPITSIVFELLADAITRRRLEHIQFIDLAIAKASVAEPSVTELQINVLLSIPETDLTNNDLAYLPGNNQDLQWAAAAAAPQLPLVGLQRAYLEQAFAKHDAIVEAHKRFAQGDDGSQLYVLAYNNCKLARELKITQYRGTGFLHILVGVKEDKPEDGLFILAAEEHFANKYYAGRITQFIVRLGYEGGTYPTETMDIVGEFHHEDGKLERKIGLPYMSEDGVRLKISWRKDTRQTAIHFI